MHQRITKLVLKVPLTSQNVLMPTTVLFQYPSRGGTKWGKGGHGPLSGTLSQLPEIFPEMVTSGNNNLLHFVLKKGTFFDENPKFSSIMTPNFQIFGNKDPKYSIKSQNFGSAKHTENFGLAILPAALSTVSELPVAALLQEAWTPLPKLILASSLYLLDFLHILKAATGLPVLNVKQR